MDEVHIFPILLSIHVDAAIHKVGIRGGLDWNNIIERPIATGVLTTASPRVKPESDVRRNIG